MSTNRALFQENATAPRLNSLMSRMLSNSIMDTTAVNENSSSMLPPIKRNLFGMRLNHDQLKDDLNKMWKEQVDRQKLKWNFDFDSLKPLHDATNHAKSKSVAAANQVDQENSTSNFKWTKVKTTDQENANIVNKLARTSRESIAHVTSKFSEYSRTTLDRKELSLARKPKQQPRNFEIFNDFKQRNMKPHCQVVHVDAESSEEEEDEALAVPQFYKYQRRLKINEQKHRQLMSIDRTPLKVEATINRTPVKSESTILFEPIFKIAPKTACSAASTPLKTKSTKTATTPKSTALVKPKPVKRDNTQTTLSPNTQNLIITFSENRKDTLRSAAAKPSNIDSNNKHHELIQKRTQKILKPKRSKQKIKASALSAFTSTLNARNETASDKMKQQSLLDLFKQRKRRDNNLASIKPHHATEDTSSGAGFSHFLRSSTAAVSSGNH